MILGILFIDPFEKEDDVVFFPEETAKIEKKVATLTIEDAIELEKAQIVFERKKLGKRNSYQAMNKIKRDEPLVMEREDIPFEPLDI